MARGDTTTCATWCPDPRVTELEGARGEAVRRGLPGVADFPAGTYPACSRHGALTAIGGGKWRCMVDGCNVGGQTAWPWVADLARGAA